MKYRFRDVELEMRKLNVSPANVWIAWANAIRYEPAIEYVVPENLKGCKDVLEILKLYQPYDDIPIFKAETNVKDLIV